MLCHDAKTRKKNTLLLVLGLPTVWPLGMYTSPEPNDGCGSKRFARLFFSRSL